VRNETLANLSVLPAAAIAAIRTILAGKSLVDPAALLTVTTRCRHGHLAAAAVAAKTLGLGSPIRLITTILDPDLASAAKLTAVYHQRWGFESSLAEIETASAAATASCAHSAPKWCARRSGRCC
jgi:hypothetical protein